MTLREHVQIKSLSLSKLICGSKHLDKNFCLKNQAEKKVKEVSKNGISTNNCSNIKCCLLHVFD